MKDLGFTRVEHDVFVGHEVFGGGLVDRVGFSIVRSRVVPAVQAHVGLHWTTLEQHVDELKDEPYSRSAGTVLMDAGIFEQRRWRLFDLDPPDRVDEVVDDMLTVVLEAQHKVRERFPTESAVLAYLREQDSSSATREAFVLPVAILLSGDRAEALRCAGIKLSRFEDMGRELPFTLIYRDFVRRLTEAARRPVAM